MVTEPDGHCRAYYARRRAANQHVDGDVAKWPRRPPPVNLFSISQRRPKDPCHRLSLFEPKALTQPVHHASRGPPITGISRVNPFGPHPVHRCGLSRGDFTAISTRRSDYQSVQNIRGQIGQSGPCAAVPVVIGIGVPFETCVARGVSSGSESVMPIAESAFCALAQRHRSTYRSARHHYAGTRWNY